MLFDGDQGAALGVHAKDTPIVPYSKSGSSESKASYYSTKKAMLEAAQHQTARHPWCWKSRSLVLRRVYLSPTGTEPNYAAVKVFDRLTDFGLAKNLTVHYKELLGSSGFILTAFVISDKRLKKRFRLWQKLK